MSRNYVVQVCLYFEVFAESEEKAIEVVSQNMSNLNDDLSDALVYEWTEPIIVAQEAFDNE